MPKLMLEPEWWQRAIKLFEQGYNKEFIAKRMGVSANAVRYVVDKDYRERKKARDKLYHPKRKSDTGLRNDSKRQVLRRYGRERFKSEGGQLRQIYRELECL